MSGERRVRALVQSAEVLIRATDEVVEEFARLSRPFIRLEPAGSGASDSPAVLVRDTPPPGGDWRRIALSSEYEPDRVLWVDDRRRQVAVVGEPSAWRTQQLLRSVRHMLRWQAYARGDLFLHGGLVRAAGTGIAFLGHKRSGKTSSMLSALLHAGADLVSNDDVVITDPPGGLTGYGSPRSINIRTDSLLALAESVPAIAGLISGSSHPTNGFRGRHHTLDAITTGTGAVLPGSVWVRCAELSRATGCRLLPDQRIGAVVLPRFDDAPDGPRLTPLDRDAALRGLLDNVEQTATKYDPFLADWFPDTDRARRERLIERLVDETPFHHLTQDMNRLAEATALMMDALGGRAAATADHAMLEPRTP